MGTWPNAPFKASLRAPHACPCIRVRNVPPAAWQLKRNEQLCYAECKTTAIRTNYNIKCHEFVYRVLSVGQIRIATITLL